MQHMESRYFGTKAYRFHDQIFRIYRDQKVLAEFYDYTAGIEYLKMLIDNETNNISSPD